MNKRMGLDALYQYLHEEQDQCFVFVDILEKSRHDLDKLKSEKNGMQKFRICIDAESCLHRLYGGYTDWVCGGQWGRMASFVNGLMYTLVSNNIELLVVFNGSLETVRLEEWRLQQQRNMQKAFYILRHVSSKATPPPKAWWLPPNCLRSAIKMVFHQPHVIMMTTRKDHHKELIRFYKERNCWGLIADDLEFAALGVKNYLSGGEKLKIFRGNIQTTALKVEALSKSLNICPSRFRILSTLLGNHILTERELIGFHASLCRGRKSNQKELVKALIEYVARLSPDADLEVLGSQIFGLSSREKISKFTKGVKYYTEVLEEKEEYTVSLESSSDSSCAKQKSQDWNEIVERECEEEAATIHSVNHLPKVDEHILKISTERHHLGLMVPWVYHILTKGEIMIPFGLEEETPMEFPSTTLFYRPLRQVAYSILLGQGTSTPRPEIYIKEWAWTKTNQYNYPDHVPCVLLPEPLPSLQELWFGRLPEHNSGRIRAFLTCMRSDTALMLNTSYVPQHYVILCAVLRYMLTDPEGPLLRKQELDCFLAQAVHTNSRKPAQNENTELPSMNPRGVLLASLFMKGVENALFANDVCGSPVPIMMCCPWLYFDGKLFHRKLLRLNEMRNLIEMCDGHIDDVATVEKLRLAILDGLNVQFAHTPLPSSTQFRDIAVQQYKQNIVNPLGMCKTETRSNLLGAGKIEPKVPFARGGRLEIAGVVVGSWSPNYGQLSRCRGRPPDKDPFAVNLRKVGKPADTYNFLQKPFKNAEHQLMKGLQHRNIHKYQPQDNTTRHAKNKKTKKSDIPSLVAPFSSMRVGIGRGCTVETNSKVMQVSTLIEESQDSGSDLNPVSDAAEETGEKLEARVITQPIKDANTVQKYSRLSDDLDFLPQFRIDEYKPLNINS